MCSVIYTLISKTEHVCTYSQQYLPIQKIALFLFEIYCSNYKILFSRRIVVYCHVKNTQLSY